MNEPRYRYPLGVPWVSHGSGWLSWHPESEAGQWIYTLVLTVLAVSPVAVGAAVAVYYTQP